MAMQMTAYYKLPLDEEDATAMIKLAREVGLPVLAVVFEAETTPNRAAAGFKLGTMVAELDGQMQAAGASAHFAETFDQLKST